MDVLNELLNDFEACFLPALTITESDEQLSSHEILSLFNSVSEIKLDELYQGLRDRGFITKMVGNQFLWIVKEKSPK